MIILQLIFVFVVAAARPTRVTCPFHWVIRDGVHEDGWFTCRPERTGCEGREEDWRCESTQPPGELQLHVACPAGTTPAYAFRSDTTAVCSKLKRQS